MDPRSLPARRRFLAQAGAAAATTFAWSGLHAQGDTWPSRPIRIVCNFPAGSSPDALVRAVSQPLQQALGQPVVIDNRAGASGIIGAEVVAKSPADGYTLLMTAGSTITTNPHVFAKMPFDPAKDLAPVAALARLNLFLVTRGDLPVKNVREFLAYLKKNPGKLTYGSAGNATGLHLAGEMLKSQAGVFAVHVPYRGASLALQDLLGGAIDFYFDPGIALQHVKAGKLKMLAIAAPQRSPLYPDVPTLDEAGLKGFDAGTTHGLYAPEGVPAAIIERLNREVNAALAQPAVRAQISALAADPSPLTPAQFDALMREDSRRYGAVIKARHITAS
ncbi:tripartite tricarboxylate transporter substrate binding protein [Ramlibacter sp. USB13]|uniref:Tripartite tricarboxylate transporter substrate binding protein n=1 Tax=Ramlibacter cellulosilyticus TaxID=2764187 RepID=A0A923MVF2_9BURK|nr:tripartite tricarboxylate transporter substrate binding protein [Ramlibacter cellulosilyticus]MBC5785895.1 tripartite tricarboxylate transporter substrate binding protein [Ramlibacter cellulosilyticus]